jgi:tetratricopeptide (TPR) repeat protein
MSDTKNYDVFLSHNSQDKEAVEELALRLEDEAQLKPWLDKWNLVPGEAWQEALEAALNSSRTCAILIGPGGISPWQNEEMRAAIEERVGQEGFRIIPVLLPDAQLPGHKKLPRFLSRLTWVDFRGPRGLKDDNAFRRLVAGVSGIAPGREQSGLKKLLDEGDNLEQVRRKSFWIILTAFFTMAAISLLAEIAQRFLNGGSDMFGSVRTIVQMPLLTGQAVLGVLACGAMVEPGREWIEKLLTQAGLFRNYGIKKRLLTSALAFLVMLSARLSLTSVAVIYNERGAHALERNDLTQSLYDYQRAISLNPDYAQAHYGLACAHERLQRYDEAISEYALSIRLDSEFMHARNNLARLYLKRGKDKDYENALQLINEELSKSPSNPPILYSLYKNRGWANYKLKNIRQADSDLRRAVTYREDGAAAHCLLGYVLEALHRRESAAEEWNDCVNYEPGQKDVEPMWLGDAKERLMRGATQ